MDTLLPAYFLACKFQLGSGASRAALCSCRGFVKSWRRAWRNLRRIPAATQYIKGPRCWRDSAFQVATPSSSSPRNLAANKIPAARNINSPALSSRIAEVGSGENSDFPSLLGQPRPLAVAQRRLVSRRSFIVHLSSPPHCLIVSSRGGRLLHPFRPRRASSRRRKRVVPRSFGGSQVPSSLTGRVYFGRSARCPFRR